MAAKNYFKCVEIRDNEVDKAFFNNETIVYQPVGLSKETRDLIASKRAEQSKKVFVPVNVVTDVKINKSEKNLRKHGGSFNRYQLAASR